MESRSLARPHDDRPRRRRSPVVIELPHDWQAQKNALYRTSAAPVEYPEGPLLNSAQIADRLGTSQRWVTDRWRAGLLPGYRLPSDGPGVGSLRFDWPTVLASFEQRGGDQ